MKVEQNELGGWVGGNRPSWPFGADSQFCSNSTYWSTSEHVARLGVCGFERQPPNIFINIHSILYYSHTKKHENLRSSLFLFFSPSISLALSPLLLNGQKVCPAMVGGLSAPIGWAAQFCGGRPPGAHLVGVKGPCAERRWST